MPCIPTHELARTTLPEAALTSSLPALFATAKTPAVAVAVPSYGRVPDKTTVNGFTVNVLVL
jgi:hypothetical protein